MPNGPWTDAENDSIVADYFAMLTADLVGQPYNKAKHNRDLQLKIGRKRGSIEYKHQNISAVLMELSRAWIPGYKPASNFQSSLMDSVLRWLESNPDYHDPLPVRGYVERDDETAELQFEPPPTISNRAPQRNFEKWVAIARKFDVAGRDERNHVLGQAGEKRVYFHERSTLESWGRSDLAKQVRWVSREEGDGAGFDIASFTLKGEKRLIEVKTTNSADERTPFYISRNELKVSEKLSSEWCLLRLWNFARKPKAFELRPPLDRHVSLIATSYEARFH